MFIKEEFFETIKKNRGQAFLCGVINLLITGVLVFNIFYYATGLIPALWGLLGMETKDLQPIEPGILDYVVMATTSLGYLIFTWMKYYIPFLVITFRLSTKQVYKNAFLFSMAGLKPNLLISAVLAGLYTLGVVAILLIPSPLTITIVLLLGLLWVPGFRSFLIQFCIFPTIRRLMIDPYYRDNPGADKQARLDLNLDVEEEKSVAAEDEPVFSDETPAPDPEPVNIPRQYSEREMRRFQSRVQRRDDDDDTI